MKTINTLIIEDHPLMVRNYRDGIDIYQIEYENDFEFNITDVNDCKAAYDFIMNCKKTNTSIDLVFLDIGIPSEESLGLLSGEDVGVLLLDEFPGAKIIISTGYDDNYLLSSVLSRITPMSVLVKTQLDISEIVFTIKCVLENKKSYSPKVSKIIDNLTSFHKIKIDEIDRAILHEISMGSRLHDMVETLLISKTTIDSRKRKMKEIFNIESDRELIAVAKDKGFI